MYARTVCSIQADLARKGKSPAASALLLLTLLHSIAFAVHGMQLTTLRAQQETLPSKIYFLIQ